LLGFSQTAKHISDSYDTGTGILDVWINTGTAPTQFPHIHNALYSTLRVKHLKHYLLQDLRELLENLASRKVRSLADTTLVQMSSELGRHNFLISVSYIL
jgi:hypothetical protein